MLQLATLIAHHSRFRPHETAVVVGGERLTWREFHTAVERCARRRRAFGVAQGDRVATLLPNCRELLEVYWAVPSMGAVLVPLSPLLMPAGLASLMRDSGAICLVTQRSMTTLLGAARAKFPGLAPERVLLIDGAVGDYGDYAA